MRTRVIINWDDNDPFPMGKRIEEAFNRVISFCTELMAESDHPSQRPPEQVAWRKVIGGEFENTDLHLLVKYARTIVQRVNEKYKTPESPVAESVIQAVDNLYTVLSETCEYVFKNKS